MPNFFLRLSLLSIICSFLASCANVTFIGHDRAYDLNVQLKSDITAPVSTNLGFESTTALAVPPEKVLAFGELFNRFKAHDGDVLPTVSRLDVTRVNGLGGTYNGINYVTVLATGEAALAATTAQPTAPAIDPVAAAKGPPESGTTQPLGGGAVGIIKAATSIATTPE